MIRPVLILALYLFFIGPNAYAADRGDFNKDGHTDVVWWNSATGQISFWLMNGTDIASVASLGLGVAPATGWVPVGAGDLNGDGNSDLVWRNSITGSNAVWFLDGMQLQAVADLPAITNTYFRVVSVNDFDGDGRDDVLWRHIGDPNFVDPATGQNAIWVMNASTVTGVIDLPTVDRSWRVFGSGDFNHDGHADIVWRSSNLSYTAVWFMNGTNLAGTGDFVTRDALAAPILSIADYTNDGHADLLLQRLPGATENLNMAVMQETTKTARVDYPAVSAPVHVIGPK